MKSFFLFARLKILKVLSSNGVWLLIERLLRMGLGLFVGAWVARYLGPVHFGELTYAFTYIAIVQAFANFGLDSVLVRDFSQNSRNAGGMIFTAFCFRLILAGSGVVISLLYYFLWVNHDSRDAIIIIIVSSSVLFQSVDVLDLYFQSQGQIYRSVLPRMSAYIVCSLLKIVAILLSADVWIFAAITSTEFLLTAIGMYVFYRRNTNFHIIFELDFALQLLKQGFPLMISAVAIVVYMRIDQFLIREHLGAMALGKYSAVIPINSIWYIIPTALCSSLAPGIAKYKIQSEEKYRAMLLKLFRLCLISALCVIFVMYFCSSYIIDLMYGSQYDGGGELLKVYSLANVAIFAGMAQSIWIANERRTGLAMYKAIVGGVVSYFGNLYALPIYGLVGAAYVAVIAQFVSAVFFNIFISPRIFFMQFGLSAEIGGRH